MHWFTVFLTKKSGKPNIAMKFVRARNGKKAWKMATQRVRSGVVGYVIKGCRRMV